MKSLQIGICHRDQSYAEALAEALSSRWKNVRIHITDPENQDPLAEMDYILCGSSADALRYGDRVIHLYDDPEDVDHDRLSIHRYQPIGRITAQLRNLCDPPSGALRVPGDAAKTIFWGFTSGVGGSGTSSLAQAAGRILSRLHGMEVLLVRFGRFVRNEGACRFDTNDPSLGQCLYRIVSGDIMRVKLSSEYCKRDPFELNLLGGPDRENPLCFAEEEDLYQLLHHIARHGDFQHVLLDVPAEIFCWKNLMRLCERQIVNFGCLPHRFAPSEVQEEVLRECCQADGSDPVFRIFPFRPMEDPDSFPPALQEDGADIHGQFGAEVRDLVDRMENQQ